MPSKVPGRTEEGGLGSRAPGFGGATEPADGSGGPEARGGFGRAPGAVPGAHGLRGEGERRGRAGVIVSSHWVTSMV